MWWSSWAPAVPVTQSSVTASTSPCVARTATPTATTAWDERRSVWAGASSPSSIWGPVVSETEGQGWGANGWSHLLRGLWTLFQFYLSSCLTSSLPCVIWSCLIYVCCLNCTENCPDWSKNDVWKRGGVGWWWPNSNRQDVCVPSSTQLVRLTFIFSSLSCFMSHLWKKTHPPPFFTLPLICSSLLHFTVLVLCHLCFFLNKKLFFLLSVRHSVSLSVRLSLSLWPSSWLSAAGKKRGRSALWAT